MRRWITKSLRAQRGEIGSLMTIGLLLVVASMLFLTDLVTPPWRVDLPPQRERAEMTVGDDVLDVELSLTPRERQLGLGYRDGLEPGTGMLFIFDQPAMRTFWMKGMRFCIDIIWIEDDQIVGAAEGVCPELPGTTDADLPRYASPEPVRYVLEVPAGWLEEHDYGLETPVTLPDRSDDTDMRIRGLVD